MRKLILLLLLCPWAAAQGPSYPYSVGLNWTLSTSTQVTGQNVYRSPYASAACGTFGKLTTTPLNATATTYTDQNPAEGAYCYAVTALDANGESGFSNIDQNEVIPPPPPTNLSAKVAGLQVTGTWTQAVSKPPILHDAFGCGPTKGGPYRLVKSTTPVTTLTWTASSKGTRYCVATAYSRFGQSGPSEEITVEVQ